MRTRAVINSCLPQEAGRAPEQNLLPFSGKRSDGPLTGSRPGGAIAGPFATREDAMRPAGLIVTLPLALLPVAPASEPLSRTDQSRVVPAPPLVGSWQVTAVESQGRKLDLPPIPDICVFGLGSMEHITPFGRT